MGHSSVPRQQRVLLAQRQKLAAAQQELKAAERALDRALWRRARADALGKIGRASSAERRERLLGGRGLGDF